jgi:hypothetical protein
MSYGRRQAINSIAWDLTIGCGNTSAQEPSNLDIERAEKAFMGPFNREELDWFKHCWQTFIKQCKSPTIMVR